MLFKNNNIKKEIIHISKLMYAKGMANAFEGNLSILHDSNLFITPSGICKGYLTKDMISYIDFKGNVIGNNRYKPSSEFKLHTFAYEKRKDIGAVIHAHPPYSTAFAIANKAIETKSYAEVIAFFGKIPLAKYGTPSTDEILIGVEDYIYDYDVILLANHGIVAFGKTLYDAFFKIEAAESIAKTLILSKNVGGEFDISDEKLKQLYELNTKRRL